MGDSPKVETTAASGAKNQPAAQAKIQQAALIPATLTVNAHKEQFAAEPAMFFLQAGSGKTVYRQGVITSYEFSSLYLGSFASTSCAQASMPPRRNLAAVNPWPAK